MSFSISCLIESGVVVGAYRSTTFHSRSMRNLVKFHLIASPNMPHCSHLRNT